MKALILGTFIALVFSIESLTSACTIVCPFNDCVVSLSQNDLGWALVINCDGMPIHTESGSGEFGGTICGGIGLDQCVPSESGN